MRTCFQSIALAAACAAIALHPAIASSLMAEPVETAENALVAAYPGNLQRDGERLEIRLPGLDPIVFIDRSCELLEGGDCVHYRLDAAFPGSASGGAPLFGVHETYYEGHSYVLVANDGTTIETGERPISSPDGRFLVAAASSDNHPPDMGILVLQRTDRGAVRLVRIISTGALTNYANVRWVGSGCIAFLASATDRWGAYGPQAEFRLIEATPEWTLTTDWTTCTVDPRKIEPAR